MDNNGEEYGELEALSDSDHLPDQPSASEPVETAQVADPISPSELRVHLYGRDSAFKSGKDRRPILLMAVATILLACAVIRLMYPPGFGHAIRTAQTASQIDALVAHIGDDHARRDHLAIVAGIRKIVLKADSIGSAESRNVSGGVPLDESLAELQRILEGFATYSDTDLRAASGELKSALDALAEALGHQRFYAKVSDDSLASFSLSLAGVTARLDPEDGALSQVGKELNTRLESLHSASMEEALGAVAGVSREEYAAFIENLTELMITLGSHVSVDAEESLQAIEVNVIAFRDDATVNENFRDASIALATSTAVMLAFCAQDWHPADPQSLAAFNIDHVAQSADGDWETAFRQLVRCQAFANVRADSSPSAQSDQLLRELAINTLGDASWAKYPRNQEGVLSLHDMAALALACWDFLGDRYGEGTLFNDTPFDVNWETNFADNDLGDKGLRMDYEQRLLGETP
jgi:hypothetical protein